MLLGTIMMLNVWGVIWRNQKIVLANAVERARRRAARSERRRGRPQGVMASRQNTIFSVTMLFFMVYTGHGPYAAQLDLAAARSASTGSSR